MTCISAWGGRGREAEGAGHSVPGEEAEGVV